MRIKLSRVVKENEEVDVVEALRVRAAEHVKSHIENPPRSDDFVHEKPLDLWTAKLMLEIAELFQKTAPPEEK
jgi:hypothetical protein